MRTTQRRGRVMSTTRNSTVAGRPQGPFNAVDIIHAYSCYLPAANVKDLALTYNTNQFNTVYTKTTHRYIEKLPTPPYNLYLNIETIARYPTKGPETNRLVAPLAANIAPRSEPNVVIIIHKIKPLRREPHHFGCWDCMMFGSVAASTVISVFRRFASSCDASHTKLHSVARLRPCGMT